MIKLSGDDFRGSLNRVLASDLEALALFLSDLMEVRVTNEGENLIFHDGDNSVPLAGSVVSETLRNWIDQVLVTSEVAPSADDRAMLMQSFTRLVERQLDEQ